MSKAGVSLFVFGIYLFVIGVPLLLVPNAFIGVFGMRSTSDVWIRVMAMLLLFLACYDIVAARANLTEFIRWSVYLRVSVIVFFIFFVLARLVEPILLLFGAVDFAFAMWTLRALRADARSAA